MIASAVLYVVKSVAVECPKSCVYQIPSPPLLSFPSLPLPLPLPSSLSLPSLLFPLPPFPSLRSRPPLMQLEGRGER